MNIAFIGGGNMATALIGGLLAKGYAASQLRVMEIAPEARQRLTHEFGVVATASLTEALASAEVVLLAVKPQQLAEVARQLAPLIASRLVISIAAGIRAGDISRWLGGCPRVVRAMPNTPALIRSGVTGLYALPGVSAEERERAEAILGAAGSCLWVSSEELLDAVTAVSGSGPAYVFYFIEALQQAARELGFDESEARQLAVETFLGASKLASQSQEDAATLRTRVTSKGGTTERAIAALDSAAMKSHITSAVKAAAQRAKELGDELSKE